MGFIILGIILLLIGARLGALSGIVSEAVILIGLGIILFISGVIANTKGKRRKQEEIIEAVEKLPPTRVKEKEEEDDEELCVLSVASSYSQQPENRIITISRIKDASCPFKYFKGYVEQPRQSKCFESIEAGIGQFFHSYLENHFNQLMARNPIISSQDMLDVRDVIANFRLSFLWNGRLREPYQIVRSTYTLQDFIRRLEVVTGHFNQFLINHLVSHRIISTEGRLQIRTSSCYIRGKYDLLTQDENNKIVLWDWKTGNMPRPEYYEDFRNQKIQLGIYAVWLRHRYETSDIRGTAVFLREGVEQISEIFTQPVEIDVLRYVTEWRRRLNSQNTYPSVPNNLCDWCGWNPVCPAYQNSP